MRLHNALPTARGRDASAIVHNAVVHRMLRAYGLQGGWQITFFDTAWHMAVKNPASPTLFVDSLNEIATLHSLGKAPNQIYLLGPDDDELAEVAEDYRVTMLLTCPVHWFDLAEHRSP